MKISVITPSVRLEGLEMVRKCLGRQSFREFEWVVVSPFEYKNATWVKDPPKKEGDNYGLNKAWNAAFRRAKGELFVSIVDMQWFPPDILEKFWIHYQNNPMAVISGIGHQYDQIENGKPEHQVWRDPRAREDFGSFYEVTPWEVEYCLTSVPRQAIYDVGGIDEEFDKYAALSEKEMGFRMEQLGYKFYLDQSIEYRAIYHPRLTKDWDERFNKGFGYYNECIKQIAEGKRLKLDFLS